MLHVTLLVCKIISLQVTQGQGSYWNLQYPFYTKLCRKLQEKIASCNNTLKISYVEQ